MKQLKTTKVMDAQPLRQKDEEPDYFNKLLPSAAGPQSNQAPQRAAKPTNYQAPSYQQQMQNFQQSGQPATRVSAQPQSGFDQNAFYGVRASGQQANQVGPSGFSSFSRAYDANLGAIQQRRAQTDAYLQNIGNTARQGADRALNEYMQQGAAGDIYEDPSAKSAGSREDSLRALGLLTDEYGRGALTEAALDTELSDFDRMLMGQGGYGGAQANLEDASTRLDRGMGTANEYIDRKEQERAQAAQRTRDAQAEVQQAQEAASQADYAANYPTIVRRKQEEVARAKAEVDRELAKMQAEIQRANMSINPADKTGLPAKLAAYDKRVKALQDKYKALDRELLQLRANPPKGVQPTQQERAGFEQSSVASQQGWGR